MSKIESYAPGSFCWAELASTDTEGAKKFYREMFGWNAVDFPMPMGVYTIFQVDGNDAGAMYSAPSGMPSNWGVYFSVASADDAAAKIPELGGKIVMGPMDVGESGRMAVAQDPQGTMFSVCQAKATIGLTHGGPLGMASWPELHTPDAAAAAAFYGGLFGWTTQPPAGLDTVQYAEWSNGKRPFGGLMPMKGPEWQGIPPHWMIYVTVADCDERAAKVKELGGNVCVPPTDIPNVGRFAVVDDPQGATFSIVKMGYAQ